MPDLQRRTFVRRARVFGSRAGAECRICVKPTRKTPPTDSSRSRVELIVITGRPCASCVVVMAVRAEVCNSPSAKGRASTGSKRKGRSGVFMGSILGAQPGAVYVQLQETRT